MKQYNETAFRELEDKMLLSLENEKKLKDYIRELEKSLIDKNTSKLNESEERVRFALEGANDGIWDVNMVTGEVYMSERGCEIIGYTHDELSKIVKVWSDIVHPLDKELTEQRLHDYIEGKTPIFEVEQRLKTKSGDWKWVLTRGKAVEKDSSGEPVRMVGTHTDISDRKKAEEELKQKNIFIQTVLDNLPIGVALNIIDQGKTFYMNKKFEEIYGWPAKEMEDINEFFCKVYPDENYRNELAARVMADIQSGDPERMKWDDCRVAHKDGSRRIVNAVNIPLFDQNTMVSTVMDITDIKKAQEALIEAKEKAEQMSRLKSSFLSNMSHELRTPLVGILGFAEILSPELDNPEHLEMVNNIYKTGKRLNETLNLILDFSKAESDKIVVTSKKTDVVALLKERTDLFSSVANLKNLKLETVIHYDNIPAFLDERLFIGILNNLINNALKFTKEGTITVEIGKENIQQEKSVNQWFYVKVKDTGIGISEENLNIIFHEFRQVSEGFGRSFEGTGLGLTITKRITELMGGVISVESKLGVGSVFTVKFPALENFINDEKEKEPWLLVNVNGGDMEVEKNALPLLLYVEDDEQSRNVVRLFLRDTCRVEFATTGEAALQMAKEKNYDIILMDINLGRGIDGIKVTKELKEMPQYKSTPIIAVTAFSMQGDKEEFLAGGCTHYISKPFSKKEFIDLIMSSIEKV